MAGALSFEVVVRRQGDEWVGAAAGSGGTIYSQAGTLGTLRRRMDAALRTDLGLDDSTPLEVQLLISVGGAKERAAVESAKSAYAQVLVARAAERRAVDDAVRLLRAHHLSGRDIAMILGRSASRMGELLHEQQVQDPRPGDDI